MITYHSTLSPTSVLANSTTPGYDASNVTTSSIAKPWRSASNPVSDVNLTMTFSPAQVIYGMALYGANFDNANVEVTYVGATTIIDPIEIAVDPITQIGKGFNRIYFEQYPTISQIRLVVGWDTPRRDTWVEIGAIHLFGGNIETRWPAYQSTINSQRPMRSVTFANGSRQNVYFGPVRTIADFQFQELTDDDLTPPQRIEQLGHEGRVLVDVGLNWWVLQAFEEDYAVTYTDKNVNSLRFRMSEVL